VAKELVAVSLSVLVTVRRHLALVARCAYRQVQVLKVVLSACVLVLEVPALVVHWSSQVELARAKAAQYGLAQLTVLQVQVEMFRLAAVMVRLAVASLTLEAVMHQLVQVAQFRSQLVHLQPVRVVTCTLVLVLAPRALVVVLGCLQVTWWVLVQLVEMPKLSEVQVLAVVVR
jgi:hypothetical protein